MAAVKIPAFPYEQADYDYAGDALKKSWDRLHRGDREPFPADAKLQSAWRAFHRGDFSKAIAEGSKLKASGATVASKSAAVAATYLVDDDKAAIRLLLEAAEARGCGDARVAGRRQCLVHAGLRPRPLRAERVRGEGAGGRHRQQGQEGARPRDRARAEARRCAHCARALPRRDHRQGRRTRAAA